MADRTGLRMLLVGLTALAGGVMVTAAVFEGLVLTDFTSAVVDLGIVVGVVSLLAAVSLIVDPETGILVAMLAGVLTVLTGVIEIAAVGFVWQAPQASQPAWLQELFDLVVGAAVGAVAIAIGWPRARSVGVSRPRASMGS